MTQFRLFAAVFFVLCMTIVSVTQEGSKTASDDSVAAEQQVKRLEQQVRTAVIKGDTSVLEQYLSDDYVGIDPNGQVADKSRTIQDLKNGAVKYTAIDVTEERVRMYGDTGIYTGQANVRMAINGQPQTAEVRATIVWVKQGGQWKRASFQATRVQAMHDKEKE
jgi:ketosteroid isomerase-like protein